MSFWRHVCALLYVVIALWSIYPDCLVLKGLHAWPTDKMNNYRQKVIRFKIDAGIVVLNVFPRFSISDKLSDFAPISKPMPLYHKTLLLQPFKEQQLLLSRPIRIKHRKIEPIDHMVFVRHLFKTRKAPYTVIALIGQYLSHFTDILLANITLDLVGGVHDILSSKKNYIKEVLILIWTVICGLDLCFGFAWGFLVALDQEFPKI